MDELEHDYPAELPDAAAAIATVDALAKEYPDPLSWTDQQKLEMGEYLRYVAAMSRFIDDDNLLYLRVLESTRGRKPRVKIVGIVSGGFGIVEGSLNILSVECPAKLLTLGTLLFQPGDIKKYVPSALSTEAHELGEGHPDLRHKNLILQSEHFGLHIKSADLFAAEYAIEAGEFTMIGPLIIATRELTKTNLSRYSIPKSDRNWKSALGPLATAPMDDASIESLPGSATTPLT